jgi:hypothetical protein
MLRNPPAFLTRSDMSWVPVSAGHSLFSFCQVPSEIGKYLLSLWSRGGM